MEGRRRTFSLSGTTISGFSYSLSSVSSPRTIRFTRTGKWSGTSKTKFYHSIMLHAAGIKAPHQYWSWWLTDMLLRDQSNSNAYIILTNILCVLETSYSWHIWQVMVLGNANKIGPIQYHSKRIGTEIPEFWTWTWKFEFFKSFHFELKKSAPMETILSSIIFFFEFMLMILTN